MQYRPTEGRIDLSTEKKVGSLMLKHIQSIDSPFRRPTSSLAFLSQAFRSTHSLILATNQSIDPVQFQPFSRQIPFLVDLRQEWIKKIYFSGRLDFQGFNI